MNDKGDKAAVWFIVNSLVDYLETLSEDERDQVFSHHGGQDGYVRDMIPVAQEFEAWASEHVDFEVFDEIWCYWLDCNFAVLYHRLLSHSGDWPRQLLLLGNVKLIEQPTT